MLHRVLGVFWFIVGIVILVVGLLWNQLMNLLFQLLPGLSNVPFPCLLGVFVRGPGWGDVVIPIGVGGFLMLLGFRLIQAKSGIQLVAAFSHVVLALTLLLAALIVFQTPDTCIINPQWRYTLVLICMLLALVQFPFVTWLYRGQPAIADASGWKPPRPQCPKCGRQLVQADAQPQCIVHDMPLPHARLADARTGQAFSIPLPGAAIIGTGEQVHILLDDELNPQYRSISQRHAEITYDMKTRKFSIVDLGSKSGTTVSALPLQPRRPTLLPVGAQLKLGGVPFSLSFVERTQEEIDAHAGDIFEI